MTAPRKFGIDQLTYGGAAVMAAASGALFLVPAPRHDIAPFASPAASPIVENADAPEVAPPAVDPEETAPQDLQKLAGFFDLSSLPEPPPPVLPPPDPAAELKLYRYAGGAAVGDRQKALFEGTGGIRSLRLGDDLAGFTLTRIDQNAAIFVKEGLEVALPLGAAQ